MLFCRTFLVAFCVSVVAPTIAIADDRTAAKQHYERGTTLYDLGNYIAAAHEYEAAYDAHSDAALLFNIGQAYRLGGDNASAIRAYRSYLRRVPNAENRGEVERLLSGLTAEQSKPSPPPQQPASSPKPVETPQSTPSTVAPPTATTSAPSATPTAEASVTKTAERPRPVYKRWWFWTIAGVVVVGGAVTAALVATTPNNANAPSGALTISFP